MVPPKSAIRNPQFLIAVFLIAIGFILRLAMFLHNRNLIIDEANIVRNLAERSFAGLTKPLSYEQYAPPVFLWIEKLVSLIAGYGEMAMRFYPLLCGLGVLFLFPFVARRLMPDAAVLLPLAYLAGGFIFIKYSAEVKQYMPDAFIALGLLWLALRWNMRTMPRGRFILYWVLAGSAAIWSSMPSVFVLTGVGCYYAWPSLRAKRWRDFGLLAVVGAVWLAQFALYYETILKAQINSSYLQNYHFEYFLYATPANGAEWKHNWERIEDIIGNVGGWSGLAVVTNLGLFLAGSIYLMFRQTALGLLVVLPIGLVLVAAAFNQFSLIDRVVLFMLPLWLLAIGAGFGLLWRLALPVRIVAGIVCGYAAWMYMSLHILRHPYEFHEITKGLDWIKSRGASGGQLYVHDANVPTYIYYTELHPQKAQWLPLLGAHRLHWEDYYDQVTRNIRDTAYFLYTGGFSEGERTRRLRETEQHMKQVAYYEYAICFVFVYVPKDVQAVSSGVTPN